MKKFVFIFSAIIFVVSSLMVITYANYDPDDDSSWFSPTTTTRPSDGEESNDHDPNEPEEPNEPNEPNEPGNTTTTRPATTNPGTTRPGGVTTTRTTTRATTRTTTRTTTRPTTTAPRPQGPTTFSAITNGVNLIPVSGGFIISGNVSLNNTIQVRMNRPNHFVGNLNSRTLIIGTDDPITRFPLQGTTGSEFAVLNITPRSSSGFRDYTVNWGNNIKETFRFSWNIPAGN